MATLYPPKSGAARVVTFEMRRTNRQMLVGGAAGISVTLNRDGTELILAGAVTAHGTQGLYKITLTDAEMTGDDLWLIAEHEEAFPTTIHLLTTATTWDEAHP